MYVKGCVAFLRVAQRCGLDLACCPGRTRAHVETAGVCSRRRAGGEAALSGLEAAASHRGKMLPCHLRLLLYC